MTNKWIISAVLALCITAGCYDMRSQFYKSKLTSGSSTNSANSVTNAGTLTNLVAEQVNQLGTSADMDAIAKKLVEIGDPAIPRLVHLLKGGSKDQRSDAVYVLVRMKKLKPDVFSAMENTLDKPDTDVVRVALEIQKFYPDSEKAADVLTKQLKSGNVSDRVIIARTLSLTPSEKYVSALLQAVKAATEEELGVSLAALQTLTDIVLKYPATGPQMVPALIKALEYDSGEVRCQAAKCLGMIGPPAKSAVPALLKKKSNDNDPMAGKAAATAIERINAVKKPKGKSKTPLEL